MPVWDNKKPDRSQVWWWLALTATVVALLEVAASALKGRTPWLAQLASRLDWLAALVVLACMAAVAVRALFRRRRGQRISADRWFAATVFSWLLLMLSCAWTEVTSGSPAVLHLSHQFLQMALVLGSALVLVALEGSRSIGFLLLFLQWQLGSVLLMLFFSRPTVSSGAWWWWQLVNVCLISVLFLWLGRGYFGRYGSRHWHLMTVALVMLGASLYELVGADGMAIELGAVHAIHAGMVFVLWQIAVEHHQHHLDQSPQSALGLAFAHSSLRVPEELGQPHPSGATRNERRRIAQELHDGVGSQIVAILASLDRRDPRERHLVISLEQCLLDLKILVDAIDDVDEDLSQALGRLRYRVQPSLDRLGIHLHWDVPYEGALEKVRGEPTRQVLRVVQEALANVMRHAQARNVWVQCGLDGAILFTSVSDDGQGFVVANSRHGKGMEGMRRRADSLGGVLDIVSQPGSGSRVLLRVPLPGLHAAR